MKYTYLATFLSGTTPIVERSIRAVIPDAEIKTILDGSITFETEANFLNLTGLGFVNNLFVVLKEFTPTTSNSLNAMTRWCVTHDLDYLNAFVKKLHFNSFRVRFVEANTFVSHNATEHSNLESKISKDLHITINRHNPDTEIWFMQRSEGYSYILLRLTNNSQVEHRLKGQLRPEIAYLMCLLSEPNGSDIFLDPFAGYGTILYERQKFPAKQIFGFEKDLHQNEVDTQASIQKIDFFKNELKFNSITKIVTDPPWGIFDRSIDVNAFYEEMFKEFNRLLTNKGILILLVGRDISLQHYLDTYSFSLAESYDILVSGKKATIYKLIKY